VEGEPRWQTIGMVGQILLLVAHTVDEEDDGIRMISARKATRAERESMPAATRKPKTEVRKQTKYGQPLTAREKRELAAIAELPDDQIDTSDILELPLSAWKDAVRGKFYRPVKRAVSMRLDADVIAWLKKPGKGYQTRANEILRQRMLREAK